MLAIEAQGGFQGLGVLRLFRVLLQVLSVGLSLLGGELATGEPPCSPYDQVLFIHAANTNRISVVLAA